MTAATLDTRKNRTALLAFGGALAMLGLGYAAVPLYQLFCQVTGFGGTTQRATESDAAAAREGRFWWATIRGDERRVFIPLLGQRPSQ